MNLRTGLIVQARSTSTRLPKKIFKNIYKNLTLLDFILNRLSKTKNINSYIVATTKKDFISISKIANKYNFITEIGSEKNVLSRFYKAAKKNKLDIIVRINSDSPFLSSFLIDKYLKIFKSKKVDYLTNILIPTFPYGIGIEIFNFKSLQKSFSEATKTFEKEHVTPFIYNNSKKFKIYNVTLNKNLSNFRFVVDYKEDLNQLKKIILLSKKGLKINYIDAIKIIKNNSKLFRQFKKFKNQFSIIK